MKLLNWLNRLCIVQKKGKDGAETINWSINAHINFVVLFILRKNTIAWLS